MNKQDQSRDDSNQLKNNQSNNSQQEQGNQKSKKKSNAYWIGFIILVLIVYGVSHFGGAKLHRLFHPVETPAELLSQQWPTQTVAHYNLSFSTPIQLEQKTMNVPESEQKLTNDITTYYASKEGLTVMLNCIDYKPMAGMISLQAEAAGTIKKMKARGGVSDFKYQQTDTTKNGVNCYIQKGGCTLQTSKIAFMNSGYQNGTQLIQLLIAYHAGNETAEKAAARIIDSVQFKKAETPAAK